MITKQLEITEELSEIRQKHDHAIKLADEYIKLDAKIENLKTWIASITSIAFIFLVFYYMSK